MKDKNYYNQFNNCDNIRENFDYLTIPQAALIWCGVPRSEINQEVKQCKPKGDTNGKLRNTFIHPYIECVEPRCVILLEAFDTGKLKMGRDGGNSDYIWGERDKTEPTHKIGSSQGIGHINPDRRTIKIKDLKDFIQNYHPDDMPKTLFSDIEIHKQKPFTHDDYSALLAKNQALEARLDKAKEIYKSQKNEIAELKNQLVQVQAQPSQLDEGQGDTFLILGAVIECIKAVARPNYTQTLLINEITNAYPNVTSLSESTLEKKFPKAKTYLKQRLK